MQMMWPGAPTVYYGDEAGVCGWTDPDNRRTYPVMKISRCCNSTKKPFESTKQHGTVYRFYKMLYTAWGILGYGRLIRMSGMQSLSIIHRRQ